MIDHTHDPHATSWVAGADEHPDFPVQNLPLCIFSSEGRERRAGVAIGDFLVDLPLISEALGEAWVEELGQPVLNAFLALGSGPRIAPMMPRGCAAAMTVCPPGRRSVSSVSCTRESPSAGPTGRRPVACRSSGRPDPVAPAQRR